MKSFIYIVLKQVLFSMLEITEKYYCTLQKIDNLYSKHYTYEHLNEVPMYFFLQQHKK